MCLSCGANNIGYSGEDCSQEIACVSSSSKLGMKILDRCPGNCSMRGVCIDGECNCETGFTGESCEDRTCPDDCSGHGICDGGSGRCTCSAAYTGPSCAVIVATLCPNNCTDEKQVRRSWFFHMLFATLLISFIFVLVFRLLGPMCGYHRTRRLQMRLQAWLYWPCLC